MDSLIVAAAQALASGDPLGALKRVALRDDAPALALRGIAMAQLGDLVRAKTLLKSAARAFGPREAVARARCVVAEAEIALVSRDLGWPEKALETARAVLDKHGDRINAAHARNLQIRRLLLIGHLDEAERLLAKLDPSPLPPAARASHELAVAGIAIRRLRTEPARGALARAAEAARKAGIPALTIEVRDAAHVLDAPAARLIAQGRERLLSLGEVEALLSSGALVVDACRNVVRSGGEVVSLASRPVLFTLARALAEAAPADAPRAVLLSRAFRARHADEIPQGAAQGGNWEAAHRVGAICRYWRDDARLCAYAAWKTRYRCAGATCRGGTCLPACPAHRRRDPGRVRRWRSRWPQARARCSGRSMHWRPPGGCKVSAMAALVAG